jgi:hypothetical protein
MTETLTPRVRIDNAKELAFELITSGKLDDIETALVIEHLAKVALYIGSENYVTADWWYDRLEDAHSASIG